MTSYPSWVDDATSAHALQGRIRNLKPFVECVSDIRAAHEEVAKVSTMRRISGLNDKGNIMWAARVPYGVMMGLIQVNPEFGSNPALFCKWLDRHPEWQTGKYQATKL